MNTRTRYISLWWIRAHPLWSSSHNRSDPGENIPLKILCSKYEFFGKHSPQEFEWMKEIHPRPWPHCLIDNIQITHRNNVVILKCAQLAKTNLERPSRISFGVGLVGYRHLVAFFTFRENHAANHKQTILLHKNLLTTHYNTETGKMLHSNEKLEYEDVGRHNLVRYAFLSQTPNF